MTGQPTGPAAPIVDPATVARLFALQASHNIFEQLIELLYRAVLRPGDLAVDGGAHMGVHTWPMAAMVGAGGRVIAVEAIPQLAGRLLDEAARRQLPQVVVEACALAAENGRTSFHWVRSAPGYSGLRERDYEGHPVDIEIIDVAARRLAELLADASQPWRFAKLDLEGGEFHALCGAGPAIAAQRPLLVFENGRAAMAGRYGYTADDWFELFARLDYALFDLFGRPFGAAEWHAPAIPWYTIAAPRGSVFQAIVERQLPALVRTLLRSVQPPVDPEPSSAGR